MESLSDYNCTTRDEKRSASVSRRMIGGKRYLKNHCLRRSNGNERKKNPLLVKKLLDKCRVYANMIP